MKYCRFFGFLFLIFIGFSLTCHPTLAQEQLHIKAEAGIEGKIQRGKGFPVAATLTNNSGELEGDLVVSVNPSVQSLGSIAIPVQLEEGETKTIRFSLPGLNNVTDFSAQTGNIQFYEGGWKRGKQVEFDGDKQLNLSYINDTKLAVGVLSDKKDAFKQLKLSEWHGESPEVFLLSGSQVPDNAQALELLDIVMINHFDVTQLDQQQQNAIINWVAAGGHLFVSSAENGDEFLGELSTLMPFERQGTATINGNALADGVGELEVATGKTGSFTKVVHTVENVPIVFNRPYGLGEITELAVDVSDGLLPHFSSLWGDLLLEKAGDKNWDKVDLPNRFTYEIGDVNETMLTSLPPFSLLVSLFIIYLFIIVPVVYVLLRRFGKKEWGWLVIPALALLSTASIFAIGAKDRLGGVKVNEVGVLAINEDGRAAGYGLVSVMGNGGTYELNIEDPLGTAFPTERSHLSAMSGRMTNSIVEKGSDPTNITFKNVEYWSPRSVMSKLAYDQFGTIKAKLTLSGNTLNGEIENAFPFPVSESYLLMGSQAIEIGALENGEKRKLSIDVNTGAGMPPTVKAVQNAYPGYRSAYEPVDYTDVQQRKRQNDEHWKHYNLLSYAIGSNFLSSDYNMPVIVAFSDHSLLNPEITGNKNRKKSLHLMVQPVVITVDEAGPFTVESEEIKPSIVAENDRLIPHEIGMETNKWFLEPGKYELRYPLPKHVISNNAKFESLKVELPSDTTVTYSLYDNEKDDYVPLDGSSPFLFEGQVDRFIQEDGTITYKLVKNAMDYPEVMLPRFTLKGEFAK